MYIKRISIVILVLTCTAYGQGFKYLKVNNIPDFIADYDESYERDKLLASKKNVCLAIDYLPKEYVIDGSIDYTENIQRSINENEIVVLPNFPILINDNGLELRSNSTLIFDTNSYLRLVPSIKTNYEILRIHKKNNILIFAPKIVGDRYTHKGLNGEWGMGISIKSSSEVTVINANISNCWGDGIYLGQIGEVGNNNIVIDYGIIDNNRRNGISIISCSNLKISNVIVSNTNGTSPEAGIDFEPNFNREELTNILLTNIYTFNNKTQGLVFYLGRLRGEQKKIISIVVRNYINRFSKIGIGYSATEVKGRERGQNLEGEVLFDNVLIENTSKDYYKYKMTLKESVRFFKMNEGNHNLLFF